MSTFVIIPLNGGDSGFADKLVALKNKAMRLPGGEWLVAYDGTSKQLSDEFGISDNDKASAIVIGFSAYWGRAGSDVWEWIKANMEKL